MKTSLLATAWFVASLAACQPQPEPVDDAVDGTVDQPAADVPPAIAPAPVDPVVPGDVPMPETGQARYDGYGDMRFGMSAEAATTAWGGELTRLGGEADTCYYLTPKWVAVPSDFAFMIENDKFVRYGIGTDKEAAPGGGKVGMSATQVYDLYAGRVEERPHKYVEGGKNLRIQSEDGASALIFEIDAAGKVTAWRAGVPPQVDYVEGCS